MDDWPCPRSQWFYWTARRHRLLLFLLKEKLNAQWTGFCLMLKSWLIYLRACSCKCIYSRLNELIKRYWCCTLEEERDSSVSSSGECLKLFRSCWASLHFISSYALLQYNLVHVNQHNPHRHTVFHLHGTIAHLFHLEFEMNRIQFYVPDYLLTCWSNKTKLA